jgi:hypothetical protein
VLLSRTLTNANDVAVRSLNDMDLNERGWRELKASWNMQDLLEVKKHPLKHQMVRAEHSLIYGHRL